MDKKMIITIARQFGSGGREIGEKLAKSLDIKFYDKELISRAAKESGMSKELFERVDETAANSFLYSIVTGAYMIGNHVSTNLDLPINDKLFIIQSDIIKDIAAEGSCVIVGRCADYILRDNPDCIKLFIHADLDKRIEKATRDYGLAQEKAEANILKTDKKRGTYYNYYTGEKWGIASNYHMCLDSGVLGIDGTVEVIKAYIENVKTLSN